MSDPLSFLYYDLQFPDLLIERDLGILPLAEHLKCIAVRRRNIGGTIAARESENSLIFPTLFQQSLYRAPEDPLPSLFHISESPVGNREPILTASWALLFSVVV